MKYKIIRIYGCPETDNLDITLEAEVNDWIFEGWKPIGSICVVNVGIPEDHNKSFVEV